LLRIIWSALGHCPWARAGARAMDILSRLLVYYVILPAATSQRVGFPCPWPCTRSAIRVCVLRSEVVGCVERRWCDCIRRAWERTTEKHSVTNLCRTCKLRERKSVSILSNYAGQRKRRTASRVGPSHGPALLWPPPLMNILSSRSTQISCW